jgi:predicted dehydrogenase
MGSEKLGRKVNVGLIGYGGRGQVHARAVADCPGTNLVAVCDRINERRKEAEDIYGVEIYSDVDEMLKRREIEAVVIVSQVAAHAPLSIKVLKSGKHVLCEKPIAETFQSAMEMVNMAKQTGLKAVIGYQQRFSPFYNTLKDVAVSLDPLEILMTGHRSIFLQKYLKEGSAYGIMDSATHGVDIINWLMDKAPVSVYAALKQGIFTNTDAYDLACLHINYGEKDDVRTGNLIASMGGVKFKNTVQLIGKKGSVQEENDETIKVVEVSFSETSGTELGRQKGEVKYVHTKKMTSADNPTLNLYVSFADYINGGDVKKSGIATFEDGLNAFLVTEAAVQSHKKGEKVKIEDIISNE